MAPREAAYDRPGGYLPRPHPYSLQSVRRTHATPPSPPVVRKGALDIENANKVVITSLPPVARKGARERKRT